MLNKIIVSLSILWLFATTLSACTTNSAECQQDSDCSAGQYCASGGGVFFTGGICAQKDHSPNNDSLDASSDVSDVNDDTHSDDATTSSDALLSDVPPDNNDTFEPDSDDFDTTPPTECVLDEQCEQPSESAWGECKFELPCDTEGQQTRELRTATCENNVCTSHTTTQQQACTRITDDIACGQSTSSDWSECSFDGKKSRQTYTPTCKNSACTTAVGTEEVPCSCTNNDSCGSVTYGQWQSCTFANTCASSGTKTREVKTPTCTTGACSIVVSQEQQACTRPSTAGQSCGTQTSSNWSVCSNPNLCATSGTQTRQIQTPTCENDTCNTKTTTETQNCALTPPTTCGAVTESAWSTCSNPNLCATSGTQTRQIHTPTCENQTCSTKTTTQTQNCALTPQPTCGAVTYSNWSTCTYSSTCANSGTHSRTKTTPTCQNGTCSAVNTTETAECGTRNTNNTICGERKLISHGACSYLQECDTFGDATPNKYTTPVCLAGTCSGEKIDYLSPDCSRNTNGNPCGNKNQMFCNNGCCGICQ